MWAPDRLLKFLRFLAETFIEAQELLMAGLFFQISSLSSGDLH